MATPTIIRRGQFEFQVLPVGLLPFETRTLAFKVSILLTWAIWTIYMAFQISVLLRIEYARSGSFHWQLWTALISEILLDFPSAVLGFSIALCLFSVPDATPRPSYVLQGDSAPDVDVLVTCCGEPVSVVSNTAAAAAAQDYPPGRLRVYVLDDGHDDNLKKSVEWLNRNLSHKNSRIAPIIYLSRKLQPGEFSNFKSGNLRFGIQESRDRLGSDQTRESRAPSGSQFLAALDADMIPGKDWLRKMVPHLLLDDNLGLACPPQNYYNVPRSDGLGQQADFDIYFTVQEALNDRLGASMCTGTGYVARRSAIESIGGWPLAISGEDYLCSAMLSDKGWGIAFVRERLQYGLAPGDIKCVIKQRMRWTDAGIEVCQRLGYFIPAYSQIASRMTPGQRAVSMLYVLRDFSPLGITTAMVAMPLAIALFSTDRCAQISHQYAASFSLLKKLAITLWTARTINTWLMYSHVGLGRLANFQSQEIWTAPYSAYRNVIALLPHAFSTSSFVVCGAMNSPLNERSRKHRKRLTARMLDRDVVAYIIYICYGLIALLTRPLWLGRPHADGNASWLSRDPGTWHPLPGATLKLLGLVAKMCTPVRYMIWPPDVPEWESLVREDRDGVKRPDQSWDTTGRAEWTALWWLFALGCEIAVLSG